MVRKYFLNYSKVKYICIIKNGVIRILDANPRDLR